MSLDYKKAIRNAARSAYAADRVALRYLEALESVDEEDAIDFGKASNAISKTVALKLRQEFRGPRGQAFFMFYIKLRRIAMGEPHSGRLYPELRKIVRDFGKVKARSDKKPPSYLVMNQLTAGLKTLQRYLREIEKGTATDQTWRRLANIYAGMIISAGKDKGVWIKLRMGSKGTQFFPQLQKMRPQEEKLEQLRDDDPETYALLMDQKKSLKEIDNGLKAAIEIQGKELIETRVNGRYTIIGKDPVTGEMTAWDRRGRQFEISKDERGRWVGEYVEQLKKAEKERRKLYKVQTKASLAKLNNLRSVSDEEIRDLDGEIEWVSLTDDKAKAGKLTRMYPVQTLRRKETDPNTGEEKEVSRQVIMDGRFKGVFLDDCVSANGRLVEGTCYDYNPRSGKTTPVPTKRSVRDKEPFITVIEVKDRKGNKVKKLQVQIPSGNDPHNKKLRNDIYKLASNRASPPSIKGSIPSVQMELNTRRSTYTFDLKDFGTIRESLGGGLALSESAIREVKDYYAELAIAERATNEENLKHYSLDRLEGFASRKDKEGNPAKLNTQQKQALAWLDANGNRGLVALDTGVGKTLTAIASMQKFKRDGATELDNSYTDSKGREIITNGRFLWVCPKALKGNLTKEIKGWLSNSTQSDDDGMSRVAKVSPRAFLEGQTDIMDYDEFAKASKNRKWNKKAWDPKRYVAIYFDEAQEMSNNIDHAKTQAALNLDHPHKICLTASPMERDPMQAYILGAISNNIPLAPRSPERKEMRRFAQRYCEMVGTEIVGVKDDPAIKRELDTWAKRNIFYADKTDVHPDMKDKITRDTQAIEMDPEVEEVYRTATKAFSNVMESMVSLYRDKGIVPNEYKTRKRKNKETGEIEEYQQLDDDGQPIPLENKALDTRMREEIGSVFKRKYKQVLWLINGMSNSPETTFNALADMIETGKLPPALHRGEREIGGRNDKMLVKLIREVTKGKTPDELRAIGNRMGNPKVEAAQNIVEQRMEEGGRSILFSDDEDMVLESAARLSKEVFGLHAAATSKSIHVFEGGSELSEVEISIPEETLDYFFRPKGAMPGQTLTEEQQRENRIEAHQARKEFMGRTGGKATFSLPLKKRIYLEYGDEVGAWRGGKKHHEEFNRKFDNKEWQQFFFQKIASPDLAYKSMSLHGTSYSTGQNLQAFNTVVHLDRDTWNSEEMKQRTARSWRQGQDDKVEEHTIDVVYSKKENGAPASDYDATLDEIQKFYQVLQGDLFDAIIKDSAKTTLGEDWDSVKNQHASFKKITKDNLNMVLGPLHGNSKLPS